MVTDEDGWAAEKAQFRTRVNDPVAEAPDGPLAREFADLSASVAGGTNVANALENVVRAVRDVVPDADLVSITLRAPDGTLCTPVRTDPVAAELDRLQHETGEGPWLDTADPSGRAHVRSEYLEAETEWPRFGPGAARQGFRSLLAVTLLPNADPQGLPGTLSIYSRRPRALLAEDREAALLLAVYASLALAGTDARSHTELAGADMTRPPRSTELIDAAGYLLVRRRGLPPDEAFDLLSYTVQDLNVKLAERPAGSELAVQ